MPFEKATRQNKKKVFSLTYGGKGRVTEQLAPTGLLANIYLRFDGQLTTVKGTGAVTLKADQYGRPFGLFDRVLVVANGATDLVNVSGQGLFLRNVMTDNGYPDILAASMVEAETGNPVYRWPTSYSTDLTNEPVGFTLKVPIANNDRDLVGLIMLQNRETLVELSIDFNAISDLFTLTNNAAVSLTGKVYVTLEYYNVPRAREDYPDLSLVHKLYEDRYPIDGTGEFQYTVPRGNIYMRMLHRVILNATPADYDDIEEVGLQYNLTDRPYYMDYADKLVEHRERYKRDLLKGTIAWDFSYQGQAGLGGTRDFVNSAGITDFVSIIKIASNATLGSNNNYLRTLHEQLVPLG